MSGTYQQYGCYYLRQGVSVSVAVSSYKADKAFYTGPAYVKLLKADGTISIIQAASNTVGDFYFITFTPTVLGIITAVLTDANGVIITDTLPTYFYCTVGGNAPPTLPSMGATTKYYI
jgi:hypothetical protein